MLIQGSRTARDLVRAAGRPFAVAAFASAAILAPSTLWAQGASSPLQAPSAPNMSLGKMSAQAAPTGAGTASAATAMASKPRDPTKPASDSDKAEAKVNVSEHMTVDLHVKDEDLANVLELLSIQTQKNIIASKNVSGKVTATLYGVTFYQALDAILHVNGFGYIENGNFIYVYTNDELKQIEAALKKRVSKVMRLNHLNASDAKEFVAPLLSKDGGEIKINEKTKDFTLSDKTPSGKDDWALGATVVVIDFEENIKAIEDLLLQLDTAPTQVLIEASVLQVALNESNAFGVDFSLIGDLNFTDFIANGGALGAAGNLIKGGSGASGQGNSPSGDAQAFTSNPGNTSGPGTAKLGIVSGNAAIFIRALDQVTDTVVLSQPKLTTLNRMPARVLVGKRVGYLNTTSTETSTTQTVNFLDTGTQLYVRPFASNDGTIRLELRPSVSSAEIRNVTDSRGSTVTIPDEVTQELTTNVRVKDGQTIVLGGLFQESTSFTRRQVPWLGDIPVLGAAFKGHDDSTSRSEIIFLVTPTVQHDGHIQAAAERASDSIGSSRAGARQKTLPWSQSKMTDNLNVEAEQLAREGKTDEALWTISRSLSLNSNQPEVIRLRERLTGQREIWNDRSMLNEAVNAEMNRRMDRITPPATYPVIKPHGSIKQPTEPITWRPSLEPGSNKTLLGTPAIQDNVPIATVTDGPQSSAQPTNAGGNSYSNQPLNGSSSSDESVYRAAMTIASFNTTEFTSNAPTATPVSNSDVSSFSQTTTVNVLPSTSTSTGTTLDTIVSTNLSANIAEPTVLATTIAVASSDAATTVPVAVPVPTSAPVPSGAPFAANVPAVASSVAPQVAVEQQLKALQAQVELFAVMNNGLMPALGMDLDNGWKPLTEAKLIENVPVNPLASTENASKIVIADAYDAVQHKNVGWVYNPRTGQLWASGLSQASNANPGLAASPASLNATPAAATKQVTTPVSSGGGLSDLLNAIAPKAQPAQPKAQTATVPTEQGGQ
jgi:type IV pilus assembly protein PilQ